jgi:hypothetical protein
MKIKRYLNCKRHTLLKSKKLKMNTKLKSKTFPICWKILTKIKKRLNFKPKWINRHYLINLWKSNSNLTHSLVKIKNLNKTMTHLTLICKITTLSKKSTTLIKSNLWKLNSKTPRKGPNKKLMNNRETGKILK